MPLSARFRVLEVYRSKRGGNKSFVPGGDGGGEYGLDNGYLQFCEFWESRVPVLKCSTNPNETKPPTVISELIFICNTLSLICNRSVSFQP